MKNIFRFAAAIIFSALLCASFSSSAFGTYNTEERLNLTEGTIANGVSLRGVSLTGTVPEKIKKEIYKPMETLMDCEVRMVSDKNHDHIWGTTVPNLGIHWNRDAIENTINASIVPHGRLLQRYKFAADHRANPVDLDYGIEIDEEKILNIFTEQLAAWNTAPVNADFTARVGSVTEWSQMGASRQVIITPGANGCSYDFSDCVHQFVENVKSVNIDDVDGDLIVLKPDVMEIEPAITTERAESMSVIGYCTTEYATPGNDEIKQNRENNLIVGIQNLDGNIFDVGARISVLELYGNVMDPENGYKKAGTYSRAGHELEMGGGLCQVTTTLYNAILEAELNVYYRHQHSYMISYVEPGLDAMVYPQGGADFIFDNDSSDIIKIEGAVDLHDQWIHIWILGHEDHAPGHRVEYESVVEGYNKANVTCIDDPSLPLGWSGRKFWAETDAQHGVNAHVIKRVYEDDVMVEEKNLHGTDIYKAMDGIIHCAPDVRVDTIFIPSLKDYYTTLDTVFLDGTSIGSNPVFWTIEERDAFDARMTALLAEKGYVWPKRGNWEYKEGEDETTAAPEDETPAEGEGGETPGGGEAESEDPGGGEGEGEAPGGGEGEGEPSGEGGEATE